MFTITSTAILFSLLSTFVNGAPLPMPAVKQSEQLASRFYNHPDSIFSHQTPCWENGLQGVLRDDVCVLAALNVEGDRYSRAYRSNYIQGQGQPCTLNGQPGFWQDAVCVLTNLNVDLQKKDFIPFQGGQECWLNGRRGYFTRDGLCDLVDLNLIADVNDGPAFFNNGLPTAVPFGNDPCWVNGKQGFWQNDLCVLADLNIAKRFTRSDGLVGDVLNILTGYEDCYNCGPGPTRHAAVVPTDNIVDAEALVDVNHLHDNFPYKRNGLVHNAPDGNEAVRTVTQLLDHSTTKRGFLGLNDIPIVSNGNTYYPNGYIQPQPQSFPVIDDTLAEINANVDIDQEDEPYYGVNHPHHLNNNLLGLKRDLLGNGDNSLGALSNLGNILTPHQRYPNSYIRNSNGQIIPLNQFEGPSDLLAEVNAAINVDGIDNNNRYPYDYPSNGKNYNHGLSSRNLGGLSDVNGLGLNKDGSFPEGFDLVPKLGDSLGAGKGKNDNTLNGLGKGMNGLNHIL